MISPNKPHQADKVAAADPLTFQPEHDGTLPIESAVYQAIGAASMCWENPAGAGVFDERRARTIAEALIEHIGRLHAELVPPRKPREWARADVETDLPDVVDVVGNGRWDRITETGAEHLYERRGQDSGWHLSLDGLRQLGDVTEVFECESPDGDSIYVHVEADHVNLTHTGGRTFGVAVNGITAQVEERRRATFHLGSGVVEMEPESCDMVNDRHVTPHRGCILR